MKKGIFTASGCKTCPYYRKEPAQGANDHVCNLIGDYIDNEVKEDNRFHPNCPLEDCISETVKKSDVKILKAISSMAEDDNQGLKMSLTILDAGTVDNISKVTFQVEKEIATSAGIQRFGLPSDYMCCAFFISRKELKKYKL